MLTSNATEHLHGRTDVLTKSVLTLEGDLTFRNARRGVATNSAEKGHRSPAGAARQAVTHA